MAFATSKASESRSPRTIEDAITLTASTATARTIIVPTAHEGFFDTHRCMILHTTGIKETASPTGALSVTYTPASGSEVTIATWSNTAASSATTVGTITKFTAAASYSDGQTLSAGDTIKLKHTKATGSSAAGAVKVMTSIVLEPLS